MEIGNSQFVIERPSGTLIERLAAVGSHAFLRESVRVARTAILTLLR